MNKLYALVAASVLVAGTAMAEHHMENEDGDMMAPAHMEMSADELEHEGMMQEDMSEDMDMMHEDSGTMYEDEGTVEEDDTTEDSQEGWTESE